MQHRLEDSLVTARYEAHGAQYLQRRHLRRRVACTEALRYHVDAGRVRQHVRPTFLDTVNNHYHNHTTTVLRPFFWDHPREPVPEENFWTLWRKGRLTEADTLTIRLGATQSLSLIHI